MAKVRIGLSTIPVSGGSGSGGAATVGPELDELVDELEKHGIDSIWLSDLVSAPNQVDPLVGLAYAAGRTRHLKLGTGVLVLPGRNPAIVAAQLAGLAALAPGRVLPAFGVQPGIARDRSMFPAPEGRRAAVFEEQLVVLRALLSEPSVSFDGEFFQLDRASVGPLPVKPLDLWLGGRAPVGLRRIGRLADGWLASFISPEEGAEGRAVIERAAADAGRAVEDDHYGTNLLIAPDEVDEAQLGAALAAARARRPDLEPERLVARGWTGARDLIARFVDAGLTKFVVRPAVPVSSRRGFLDQFVQELGPVQT